MHLPSAALCLVVCVCVWVCEKLLSGIKYVFFSRALSLSFTLFLSFHRYFIFAFDFSTRFSILPACAAFRNNNSLYWWMCLSLECAFFMLLSIFNVCNMYVRCRNTSVGPSTRRIHTGKMRSAHTNTDEKPLQRSRYRRRTEKWISTWEIY